MTTEKPAVAAKPNIGPRSPIRHNFQKPIVPAPNSHYDDVQMDPISPTAPGPAKSPLEKKIFKKILPKISVDTIKNKKNALNYAGQRRPSAKFETMDLQVKQDDGEMNLDPGESSMEKPVPQPRNVRPESDFKSRPVFRDKPLPSKLNLPSGLLVIQEFKAPSGDCPDAPSRVSGMVTKKAEVLGKDEGPETNEVTRDSMGTYEDVLYSKNVQPITPKKTDSMEIYEDTG